MRGRVKAIIRGPVVFHPVLFAAFPILFLYAYNISETSASEMWLPLGISVGAALVMWGVLTRVLRSAAKAGLATAIFLGLFFSYGRLYDGLSYLGVAAPKHAYLLPTMLFAWGYCVYFIGRAKRDFRVTTRLVNVVGVAVIAINLFNIGFYQITRPELITDEPAEAAATETDSEKHQTMPDIYHIILDEYASLSTIREHYGYDNSEFGNWLLDNGFFVAHDSRTHSLASEWSIASTLNMDYITGDVPIDVARRMMSSNEVANFLQAKGYSFVYIGFMDLDVDADVYNNFYKDGGSSIMVNEFVRILWNTTMLRPFYMHTSGVQYENYHRGGVLDSLELLKRLPDMQETKYVFAHINSPHNPFVFGPRGERVGVEDFLNFADKQVYLGQYIFITTQIKDVISALLDNSESPPIIILQSDHGPKTLGHEAGTRILNAMYLPGMDYAEISDSISPVNTYRLIFNHYYAAGLELLPSPESMGS